MKKARLFIVFLLFIIMGTFAVLRDMKVKAGIKAAKDTASRCLAVEEAQFKKTGQYYDNAESLRRDLGALPNGIKIYLSSAEVPAQYAASFTDTDAPFLARDSFRVLIEIVNSPESGPQFYVLLPKHEAIKFDVL